MLKDHHAPEIEIPSFIEGLGGKPIVVTLSRLQIQSPGQASYRDPRVTGTKLAIVRFTQFSIRGQQGWPSSSIEISRKGFSESS
jgi:hypothetical protein